MMVISWLYKSMKQLGDQELQVACSDSTHACMPTFYFDFSPYVEEVQRVDLPATFL